MKTRSSSRLASDQISNPTSSTNSNPKGRNRRHSKQMIENSNLEEHSPLVVTMADQRTMAEMLLAPTEGYAEAIMVPSILAEQFELKHSLINMMTTDQFFGIEKENLHDHIRWFNKITSTIKYKDVPSSAIKLMLFPLSLAGAVRRWLEKEPPCSIHTWEDLVSKFINEFFPPQEQQISVMKSRIFNNGLMNLFIRLGIDTKISFVLALITCLAADGNTFPELRDNIQGYVSAGAVNYNQGNPGYRPSTPAQQNQNVHLNELEKVKRMNEANMKAMQTQIDMVKNELRNEMKNSIQTSLSNQTNEIKNMMASLLQMNTASTLRSGSLANPKGELKAITTRSGLVIDGPTVPTPPQSINLKVDERVEKTFTDPYVAEYTIKVPPPPAQKYNPPSQREYVVHQRDPLHPNIPYPSRMLKQKQQEKDAVQIQNFWQMFKQLHINITLVDALILMPKYQKMLKALLSNKEKLQELANTPLNENSSAKKLGLPQLILTRMTLELANRAICTLTGIARDVFVPVGKFTFLDDFVIVDYESGPRVPLILGRPFLRTARALIDVHGEEMILRDGDERLTLNMRHGTSSYSNQPQKESINLINVFNNSKGCNVLSEKLLDLDSIKDIHPPLHDNPLSGSTTYFSNPLLEEFADELPPEYDDNLQFDIESGLKEIEFLLYQDKDSSLKDSIDQKDLANLADIFVDSIPEMFTNEHALDY
nr:hypothetical protein [Tanacetum cinerariifolium]